MSKPLSELAADAREALDSMDDFARMDVGVDAHGPRGVLDRFIAAAEDLARRVEGAPVAIFASHDADAPPVACEWDDSISGINGQRVRLVPEVT